MNRTQFNNMFYAAQVLANLDLNGMSREDAMPYLQAIDSCLRSLVEINNRDMESSVAIIEDDVDAKRADAEPVLTLALPAEEEEEEEEETETQDPDFDENSYVIDTNAYEEYDSTMTVAAEHLAEYYESLETTQSPCQEKKQPCTIPESQLLTESLHPNITVRRRLESDSEYLPYEPTLVIRACTKTELQQAHGSRCNVCGTFPKRSELYTTSCRHDFCISCYAEIQQARCIGTGKHYCPTCNTKEPSLCVFIPLPV